MKQLTLCADDYGLSPAISLAIRELISRGRLNATSVMVNAPELENNNSEDILLLLAQKEHHPNLQIGLHLTLTKSLPPLTLNAFHSLPLTLLNCFTGAVLPSYKAEIIAQFHKFYDLFGFYPDYIDGHQHVHLLPSVRQVLYKLMFEHAPQAWLRQTGAAGIGFKAKIIGTLSQQLIHETRENGIKTNVAFTGSYHFEDNLDFRALFKAFLHEKPDGTLMMLHPGRIDEKLKQRDPMWHPRFIELQYLNGTYFFQDVQDAGFTL